MGLVPAPGRKRPSYASKSIVPAPFFGCQGERVNGHEGIITQVAQMEGSEGHFLRKSPGARRLRAGHPGAGESGRSTPVRLADGAPLRLLGGGVGDLNGQQFNIAAVGLGAQVRTVTLALDREIDDIGRRAGGIFERGGRHQE